MTKWQARVMVYFRAICTAKTTGAAGFFQA